MVTKLAISRARNLPDALKRRAQPLRFLIAFLTVQAVAFVACRDNAQPLTAPKKPDFNDYDTYAAETLPDPCAMFSCHPLTEQERSYIDGVIWSIQTDAAPACLAARDAMVTNLANGLIFSADYFPSATQNGATTAQQYEIKTYLKKDQMDTGTMNPIDIVHEGLHEAGYFWVNPHQTQADYQAWQCRGFQQ